jgi:hypothetical protein
LKTRILKKKEFLGVAILGSKAAPVLAILDSR